MPKHALSLRPTVIGGIAADQMAALHKHQSLHEKPLRVLDVKRFAEMRENDLA